MEIEVKVFEKSCEQVMALATEGDDFADAFFFPHGNKCFYRFNSFVDKS